MSNTTPCAGTTTATAAAGTVTVTAPAADCANHKIPAIFRVKRTFPGLKLRPLLKML
jgi:hypothetical protein